jgi:hypothetical protein
MAAGANKQLIKCGSGKKEVMAAAATVIAAGTINN